MNNERLKILFDIFLAPSEDEDDIRSSFLERGENPDDILERAEQFLNKKEAEIQLKIGKEKQNKAAEYLKSLPADPGTVEDADPFLDNLGFAYRKNNSSGGNEEELRSQAEKLSKLKKFLGDGDEHTGEG